MRLNNADKMFYNQLKATVYMQIEREDIWKGRGAAQRA